MQRSQPHRPRAATTSATPPNTLTLILKPSNFHEERPVFAFPFQYIVSMHRLVPGLWDQTFGEGINEDGNGSSLILARGAET